MSTQAAFDFARVDDLLEQASRAAASENQESLHDEVEKALFRSPAGKRNVLRRLLPLIPPHKRYVEPFAGGAAVFFGKEPAEQEVLNDKDSDIVFAYRFIQRLTPEKIAQLKRFNWTNTRSYFNGLKVKRPQGELERFHQFIYLNRWGYFGKRNEEATFNPAHDGETFTNFDKFLKGKERLAGVTILNEDYAKVVRRFDGPETFFFFDPPFPGYDQAVGESQFDEPRFAEVLRGIKGKFLVTYGIRSDESVFKGFQTRRIIVPTATPKGSVKRALLLISNYEIQKSLGPDVEDAELVVPISEAGTDELEEARQLLAELAEVAPRLLEEAPSQGESGEQSLSELPALARQARDVLGGTPATRASGREPLWIAREVAALLPGVHAALSDERLTGARRVIERLAEVLQELPAAASSSVQKAPAAVEEALLELPPSAGRQDAVVQYHFRGKSLHLDLRMDVDDFLVGWTLLAQRPDALKVPVDTVQRARALARTFALEGDRILKSLLAPARVAAAPKGRHPRVWLEVNRLVIDEGETGATGKQKGVIFAVDRPDVEYGLQTPDSHEYFFSGGRTFNGVLLVDRLSDRGRADDGDVEWMATLHRARLPRVLSADAVDEGLMPPNGHSALPASLEEVTPLELRFWEKSGDAARKARDELVKSGFFTDANVRLVDGVLRRVIQKLYLTMPPKSAAGAGEGETPRDEAPPTPPDRPEPFAPVEPMRPRAIVKAHGEGERILQDHLGPELLAAGVVVEPSISGQRVQLYVERGDARILTSGGDAADGEGAEHIKKALTGLRRDLVLDGCASADGSGVHIFDVLHAGDQSLVAHPWRERQKVLARLFRRARKPLQKVEGRVVHTEEELREAIYWAAHQPGSSGAVLKLLDSSYAPATDASSWIEVDAAAAESLLPEDMRKLYPRYVDPEQPVVKRGSDEERFTLGIVLEPGVVDAQGDTYTKAEVRRACHRYAEFYWNAGLMHKQIVNGKVVILENYLAPCDFVADNGEKVQEGTWLQGRGYRDDKIWAMVKRGELTGLSMGGSAIRKPQKKNTQEDAQTNE